MKFPKIRIPRRFVYILLGLVLAILISYCVFTGKNL